MKRDWLDFLVEKVMRVQKEKMAQLEQLVWQGLKELKDQRVEVVSQACQAPLDLQDQKEREDLREWRDMLVNLEKREILVALGRGGETDLRGSGEILDHKGLKEEEEQGVHVASEDPQELLVPQGQRVLLVSLEFLVTVGTRDLQDPKGTGDSQDLVDQWVCQEKQVYRDFLDLVERRDHKEKQASQAPPEYQAVGVPQARGAAQELKENGADRDPKEPQETQGNLARTAKRASPVNQVWMVKTVQRVSQEHRDRKVPWDRREPQDPKEWKDQ